MTARGTWKRLELRLARDLGTERIPVTGERDGADFKAGPFLYQAKLGRRFPVYLRSWLSGIVASAERSGRVGVVVWREKGTRDAEALVCLRWRDWVDLHGSAGAPVEPRP